MKLAKEEFEKRLKSATEMVGRKFEISIARKAVTIDAEKKTATFIMSTSAIDRHGDIVDQESWILDYFNQSPMFFLQHDSDCFPIGKWLEVHFENDPMQPGMKMMVGTAEFATDIDPNADLAFKHVQAGNMNAVSVGFIPHRVEYDEMRDAFVLYDCELLECSLVGVPSNRQALIKAKPVEKNAHELAIEARQALNKKIESIADKNAIISELKAREDLNKLIRRLEKTFA